MRRGLRRLAVGTAVVLALLLAAGVWLVASFDSARYKQLAIDWVAMHTQRRLTIDGPLRLSVFPRIALRVEGLRLSEAGGPGEFAAVDRAAVAVELLPLLRGRVVADRVDAQGVRLAWRRDAQGRSNVDDLMRPARPSDGSAGERAGGPPPRLEIAGLSVSDLRVQVQDAPTGIDGEVHLASLRSGRLADGAETPLEWDLQLALQAPAAQGRLLGSARLTPDFETGSARLADADLTWHGSAFGRSGVDLRLQGALAWDGAKRSFEASTLALESRVPAPDGQPLALQARGQASGSADHVRAAFDGRIDQHPFHVAADANLSGQVPALDLQARFDALELDRWRASNRPGGASSTPATGTDAPLDLAVLRRVEARFDIQAARATWQPYAVEALQLAGTVRAGTLRVSTLRGRTWGGEIDAQASADANGQRVALQGTASGIAAQDLLRDLTGRDDLRGTGRLALDIASSGRRISELKSRLGGHATLQLRDGAIEGVNLAKVLRQARAALSGRQDLIQQASRAEATDFSELSASFRISEGVARNSDLQARSPFLRLAGDGAIDIGRSRIDYTLRATLTDTAQGQGGAGAASLRGLTVPVQLAGPLDAIEWRIRWSALAGRALQDKIEDKLREKLGIPPPSTPGSAAAPADRLKERLRGLFK